MHPMHDPASTIKAICISVVSLLLASCRCLAPSALDAASANEIEHDVRQMAASIARDVAADGPTAWNRYFADDREFFMANNGALQFSNLEDAKVFLNKFSAGVAHLELTWAEIRVDPLASGLAVMASPYREVLTDKGGHKSQYDGYFTGVAVKTRTGWKLRDAHWSSPITTP